MQEEQPQQDERDKLIGDLYDEVGRLQGQTDKLGRDVSVTAFASNKNTNLISEQLDVQQLLEKLERFYRGDYLKVDEETDNVYWAKQENADLIPLNEYGVNLLMEAATKYIDKNTALSNYPEERIYEILGDLGDELTLIILCNYEKMGMDTNFKKTRYRLIVTTTLHIVESTYRRALGGKTSEDLNQARIVNQSDYLGRPMAAAPQKKRSWLDQLRGIGR